jgi:hypothetical protein
VSGIVVSLDLMQDADFAVFPGGTFEGWTATVDLPVGAQIIAAGWKKNLPTLWAVCYSPDRTAPADYLVVADGVPAPDGMSIGRGNHVGSILPGQGGDTGFHVFELRRGDLT